MSNRVTKCKWESFSFWYKKIPLY